MSYRLLLRNNLKLYKIMSHRYYCSDGFFVCSYAFLLSLLSRLEIIGPEKARI